ncbi:MAG TPA: amino acid adenylation domain-containing protein, partial [Pyrinomonadaceae bacterium]|nr:amino acid adenylation domain-containing protein [Pyrinomonadaceae bacterium]
MTAEIEEIYTLSPLQQGLLFHTLYAPESGDYFGQSSCRLKAALDVNAFQHAWERVVERHSILRTSFVWEMTDEPLQVVHRRSPPPFLHLDWSTLSSAEQEAQLEQYLEEDRRRGFDLGEAPLMRLALMSLGGDGYYFVWSHHHLLLDGWSGPVLFKEVFTFYEAERNKTKVDLPQPRPYKDYIAWLQGRQQDSAEAEAFWRHRLKGFARPTPLGIVKLANESSRQSKSRAERQIELSEQCTSDLVTFARENKLTMNTLVQGAWSLLLSRYSGDQDVLFGTTVSGRPTDLPGVETMVGLFINSLPVRVRLSGDELLLPWLKNLQEEQVEAREYSHCVLVDIQGWSDVPRGLTLFDTLLVFENYPGESSLDRQIQSLEISDYSFIGTTNFPITLVTVPGRTLILQILFDRSRVEGEAIERLLQNLKTVLASMAKGPDQHLSDISYLSNEERRLLTSWNQTQRDFPAETCIHELFTRHAERQPDAIAIIHQNTCLSYGKLNRQANRIANYLRRKGVGHETLVGIFMERSPQVVKCVLGIMKAGGAYVPLDPGYPKDRLAFMLRDAGVSVVLTEEHLLPALPKNDAQVVCIDTDWEQIALESATEVANVATADSAAYVIYTSGTTGRPKGVVVEHRGVINLARWQRETFRISSLSRVAQSFSYSFDGAVGETAMSLLNGATMVMLDLDQLSPNQLVAALNEYRINVAVFVPSLISQIDPHLLQHGSALTIVSVGEACSPHLAREWSRSCSFINAYGPTEYTVYSHLYKVDGAEIDGRERVPIGKPLHNTESFILDANLEPTPVGVSGEICISGVGLARTYLNRPDITAQRFSPNRFFFENSTIDHGKIRVESALAE